MSRLRQGQGVLGLVNTDLVRRTNLSHILEDSDGSPSRLLQVSPMPEDGSNKSPARARRPEQLGFGAIGGNLNVNYQQYGVGPKSAPPQIRSFEQADASNNRGPWNESILDSRWLRNPEEMQRQGSSNITSAYPSSTHLELLASHFGLKESTQQPERQPSGQGYQTGSSSVQVSRGHEAPPSIFPGQGFDNLRAYVEMAANGQSRNVIQELEDLMTTMLYLRGEGDALPSMRHFGRDALRQFLYKSVFGVDDGSSSFSRDNPSARVEVAGRYIPRKALHDEIVHFLENQVELMMATPERNDQERVPPTTPPLPGPSNDSRNAERDDRADRESYERKSIAPTPQPAPRFQGHRQLSPRPIQGFHAMNLREQQPTDTPAVAGGSENFHQQPQIQANAGSIPGAGQGLPTIFGSVYGETAAQQQQQYVSMMQQHYAQGSGQIWPPQFLGLGPHGMVPGPTYMSSQHPPMSYYAGRQLNPQAGSFLPYGPPYFPTASLGMHQLSGHPMQQQFLPNPSMAFNAMPHRVPQYMTASARPLHQPPPQWPQASARGYAPSSRTASPMPPRAQSRGGRHVVSDVPYLPYRPGSDDMYPHANAEGTSVRLQELQRQGPSYAVAASPDNLPFVEAARRAKPAEWGVLRIGNTDTFIHRLQIPYSLTKQEVLGFLGRNAKILTSDIGVPIHIIMDRTNGKTMDCYVEFFSHGDAQAAFNKCLLRGNQLRLGDRVVDVAMSSQDELLREMFPKAKNVEWSHGRPIVRESSDPYNSGFKAFVTNEELLQLVSYAEKPHRSNYTQKCLQRPYEGMISLLSKLTPAQFPWFAVDRYTLRTRDEMYKQTLRLIALLVDQLRRGHEAYLPHISESLLTELLYAGLNAPAFSEQQRWQLCQAGGSAGERIRMSPLVPYWPFEVLARKAGVDEDVVKEYARYLQSHPRNTSTEGPFGTWTAESNEALGLTSIGQVGVHEMQMVLHMLQDVLPPRTA
ncbi:MAG: hypothetical protein Q9185_004236 [Variospora sp. 1 TL-2023]